MKKKIDFKCSIPELRFLINRARDIGGEAEREVKEMFMSGASADEITKRLLGMVIARKQGQSLKGENLRYTKAADMSDEEFEALLTTSSDVPNPGNSARVSLETPREDFEPDSNEDGHRAISEGDRSKKLGDIPDKEFESLIAFTTDF